MKSARGHRAAVALILLMTLALSSCGYRITRPPFEAVRLGRIENRTMEAGMEDRLYAALSKELAKRGVAIEGGAAYTLEGSINEYKLKSTAERNDIAIQYELTVTGSFRLRGPDNTVIPVVPGAAYIVSFASDSTLDYLMAARQRADEQAAGYMAEGIVAALMYMEPNNLDTKSSVPTNTVTAQ